MLATRGGASEASCPFCAHSGYSVSFIGPKTAAQRQLEAREAADTLQRQRSGREVCHCTSLIFYQGLQAVLWKYEGRCTLDGLRLR